MAVKKYPVGTKVKYIIKSAYACIAAKKDIGKIGKVVGYTCNNDPIIFLPESEHISRHNTQLVPATWQCSWKSIEILPQKGEQLLFGFMSEQDA